MVEGIAPSSFKRFLKDWGMARVRSDVWVGVER
jgi:hypothetical protein